jgi:hypothetical protein
LFVQLVFVGSNFTPNPLALQLGWY